MNIVHTERADQRFLVVFLFEVNDRFDSLFLQEFKAAMTGLASAIEAVRDLLESRNVFGNYRRRCESERWEQKNEGKNAKHKLLKDTPKMDEKGLKRARVLFSAD